MYNYVFISKYNLHLQKYYIIKTDNLFCPSQLENWKFVLSCYFSIVSKHNFVRVYACIDYPLFNKI